MRSLRPLSVLAAAALLAAPAAASAAQTPYGAASPVAIANCTAFAGTPLAAGATLGFANFGSYNVGFINGANVAAKHVGIDVNDGGTVQRIDENGSFASGTRIDKDALQQTYGGAYAGKLDCSVAEVDFVDGSSWHAARATALRAPAGSVARH